MGIQEGLILALPFLIIVLVGTRGFRVSDQYVDRWAASAGLTLTDENLQAVRRYLAWSRRFRTIGALVGFIASGVAQARTGEIFPRGWALPAMLIGYLVGALIAEIALNPPRRGAGVALLVPRRLGDYLPGYVLFLQRGLALVCLTVAVVSVTFPHFMGARLPPAHRIFLHVNWLAGTPGLIVAGVLGVLLVVLVEWLQRMLIGRPQPAVGAGELALDDAMRSSSLHVLAGGGIALLLNLIVFQAALLNATVPPRVPGPFKLALPLIALVLWVASIAFWLDLSKPHGFSVRRVRTQGLPA